jgi:hypothetical protein
MTEREYHKEYLGRMEDQQRGMVTQPITIQVLSDLVSKRDDEITALRELITGIRETFEITACKCDEQSHGMICSRCWYLHYIDKGLAGLSEVRDG